VAAISNAVANAIGVRVPNWPLSPRNVLNALATASKEGKA
jgi:xanthine dehydrogenase YagR molybdenum-binding subunit